MNLAAAVVLMAYGSPDRLEDVPAYYADIRGGRPIRPELLADLVERYRQLGIEHESPLNRITEETRAALEKELGLPVFTGMRHWRPRIAEAVEEALAVGAGTIVGLVLAPHYSKMSIGSYRAQLEKALAGRAELVFVESWGDDPAFVDFMAERIRAATASRSSGGGGAGLRPVGADADQGRERPHVVFTAHSLPARILDEGDPYEAQLFASSRLVAERAGVEEWSFCYQSESPTGEPWLGPDIVDHLTDLHARGIRDVLVCPIGFVADHLEIRWDIDTEARRRADELGIRLARTDMPNAEPAFVQALAGLVREALRVPSEA